MYSTVKTICIIGLLAVCIRENSFGQGVSVLSYHNDGASSGVNSAETALTPANLTVASFSKQFSTGVDGQVYAQPLYVPSVTVTGGAQAGTHNLVLVATQHDSLYAIDADSGVVVWHDSFLASGLPGATTITSVPAADVNSSDTSPEIGICGTPVIDGGSNFLYVAAKTKQIVNGVTGTPNYVYTLYQIDITNGNATANANIVNSMVMADTAYNGSTYAYRTNSDPTATQDPFVPGTGDGAITVNGQSRVYFNALRQMNRPGLILVNGSVYICFASHGDNGPYHGWMLGFDKGTLAPTAVLNLTPNLGLGGIWGAGAIPVVDGSGNFFLMTGNGGFDGYKNGNAAGGLDVNGFPVNGDYGDCFVKVSLDTTTSVGNQNINGWGLRVMDYFAPFNNQTLSTDDTDLGSGGCLLLPDSAGSEAHPHLLVGAGKQGNIYLVDRDSMGKFTPTTDNVVQSQQAIGSSFDTPAFFNGVLYYAGEPDSGKAFAIANAAMSTSPVTTPDTFGWPGATPSISANGTNNGVVWMVDRNSAQLRAYSADNLGTEIWTSAQAPNNRDQLGTPAKFVVPTVADGRVMVGTTNALVVYGPPAPPAGGPAAPTALMASPVSALEIDLSWTDNSSNETGFSIEESTDGNTFNQIGTVGVNVTTYKVITNLQPSTLYYFRVRAFNTYQTLSYSDYTNVASTTTLAQPPGVNYPSGFAGATSTLQFNSTASIVNNRAELTDGGANETGTVWGSTAQNIQNFSTQFTFQLTNPNAEGITFAIQNSGPTAVGTAGSGLGYAGINNSVAIKFDLFDDAGEGINSTGLYVNGASPTIPATDMTSAGINLHSGDTFSVSLTYDGTNLTETITDTTTSASGTWSYPINIPATVGGNTAYVGFTGSTGTATATQDILSWTYASLPTAVPTAPTHLTATAASGTQINLSWTDTANDEAGFIVERATDANGPFMQIGVAAAGQTTYMDTALPPDTTYYYQVCATNSVGESDFTNVASALTPIPPATPTNAQPVSITTTSISMTWTNNATNAVGYNIFRKTTTASNFAQIASLPPSATSYTDTNLMPGTSYDYHIQAYNLAGASDFSGFTAETLPSATLPIVTVAASGPVAIHGLTSGQITLLRSGSVTSSLSITYAVSGTAVSGTGYAALTGSVTIPAGAASVNIPVTPTTRAVAGSTVNVSLSSTSAYQAGSPSSATVVIGNPTYRAAATTGYRVSSVAGTTDSSVTLTFPGLPGSPSGVVYVWYLNGTAFATTNSPAYTITNAITSQSGTYEVYAYAPGGATGSDSWRVSITNPPIIITTSVSKLTVTDGSSGSFTVSLTDRPIANVTVDVAISGTPALTVSPSTLVLTPQNYQNQTVAVSAAPINSNDKERSATVSLTDGRIKASVVVTDVASDPPASVGTFQADTGTLVSTNIGTRSAGDLSMRASGNWWLDGSGIAGFARRSDSFHFESESLSGDFQMVVQLQDVVGFGATVPLAGLMIRDGMRANSNFLALAGTAAPSGGYALISRTTVNDIPTTTMTTGANLTYTYPAAWLMLTRVGNILHAFVASDGATWYEVTNPTAGTTWTGMSDTLDIGLFSTSDNAVNTRAVVSNFSVSTGALEAISHSGTAGSTANGFTDLDIGGPGMPGSAAVDVNSVAVSGGGADIWSASDEFNYYSQSLSADKTFIVHVDSVQNTDPWAKGGIMFRNSTSAGAAFVGLYQNPDNLVELQWRDADNHAASWTGVQVGGTTAPKWLKLVKNGTMFTAYYATTTAAPAATDWVLVAVHSTAFTNSSYLGGLAVTAHNNSLLNTTLFSNLSEQ